MSHSLASIRPNLRGAFGWYRTIFGEAIFGKSLGPGRILDSCSVDIEVQDAGGGEYGKIREPNVIADEGMDIALH